MPTGMPTLGRGKRNFIQVHGLQIREMQLLAENKSELPWDIGEAWLYTESAPHS